MNVCEFEPNENDDDDDDDYNYVVIYTNTLLWL